MCDLTCLLEYVFSTFVLVTIPFYTVVLIVIIKNYKQLKLTFFGLFVSTGVADIWFCFHRYLFIGLPRMFLKDQVKGSEFMATISKAGWWYIYFAQVLGVLLMTINRYTALKYPPAAYHHYWNKKAIITAILFQWTFPLLFAVPMIFPCCRSHYSETLHPVFNNKTVHDIYFKIDMILEPGIIANLLIILYSLMVVKMYKHRKEIVPFAIKNENTANQMPSDRRLALFGSVLAVLYILLCVTYVIAYSICIQIPNI